MIQPGSVQERVLNQNVHFIHLANMENKWGDFTLLNEAVESLTDVKISQFLRPIIQEQVCADLKSLLEKIKVQESELDAKITATFNRKAIVLVKMLEAVSLPEEMRKCSYFHGNEIMLGVETIAGLNTGDQPARFNLKLFAIAYSEFVFSFIDRMCNQSLFLIRPCTSIPSGAYQGKVCKLFTVTSREKGVFKINDFKHILIALTEDGNVPSKGKWSGAYVENENVTCEEGSFDSLPELINQLVPGYTGVLAPKKEVLDAFFHRYFRSIGPNTRCRAILEKDFVLKALEDPIFKSSMIWTCINEQGNTYSRDGILQWLLNESTDPINRQLCQKDMLRPNILVDRLIDVRRRMLTGDETLKVVYGRKNPLLCLFIDPLKSDQLIKDPVIATDNITYDKQTLIKFLATHGNKLRSGQPCSPAELIENRAAKHVLEEYQKYLAPRKI